MEVATKAKINGMVPTIFVIFGITGDLAQRKLIPALFDLYIHDNLPKKFTIVGFSRKDYKEEGGDGDDQIRAFIKRVIAEKGHEHPAETIDDFVQHVHYQQGDFTNQEDYGKLANHLVRIEDRFGQCTNKLFYLAVPPRFYSTLFKNLAYTGLTLPCSDDTGWSRILVEKPFGKDLATAKKLDKELSLLFKEEQIFRIDHYLGKEMLQDILMFRFANSIFEPIWNSQFIEKVTITKIEKLDVAERGDFFDGIGLLRDVGQNHALQMLALIAMDRPEAFDDKSIRAARAAVFAQLRKMNTTAVTSYTKRGQYEGYRKEKGVDPKSDTETYFRLEAHVDSDRWNDVPFIIESGKALHERRTEICIHFRPSLGIDGKQVCANTLRFCIDPHAEIRMTFASKKPGFAYDIEESEFVFTEMNYEQSHSPQAYEQILYQCIRGDQTLFTSSQEVEAQWRYITPILEAWEKNVVPLIPYKKGELLSE